MSADTDKLPELFHVKTIMPEFEGYKSVDLDWFVKQRKAPLGVGRYHELVTDFGTTSAEQEEEVIEESFTADEAKALVAWIGTNMPAGLTTITPLALPIPSQAHYAFANRIDDASELHGIITPDWDLPFKAGAFFDLTRHGAKWQPRWLATISVPN